MKPCRTPRSSIGNTSGLPSLNINIISTVHTPMPRTAVSRSTMAASSMARSLRIVGTVPSSVLSARSRSASSLFRDRPAPRNASSGIDRSASGDSRFRSGCNAATRPKIVSAALPESC